MRIVLPVDTPIYRAWRQRSRLWVEKYEFDFWKHDQGAQMTDGARVCALVKTPHSLFKTSR